MRPRPRSELIFQGIFIPSPAFSKIFPHLSGDPKYAPFMFDTISSGAVSTAEYVWGEFLGRRRKPS
jgi:hypothetical protein